MKIGIFLFILTIIAFSCHDTGPEPGEDQIIWNYDSLLGHYEGIRVYHMAEYDGGHGHTVEYYDTSFAYLNILNVTKLANGDYFVNTDGAYVVGFDVSKDEVTKDTILMTEHFVVSPLLSKLTYFRKEQEIFIHKAIGTHTFYENLFYLNKK